MRGHRCDFLMYSYLIFPMTNNFCRMGTWTKVTVSLTWTLCLYNVYLKYPSFELQEFNKKLLKKYATILLKSLCKLWESWIFIFMNVPFMTSTLFSYLLASSGKCRVFFAFQGNLDVTSNVSITIWFVLKKTINTYFRLNNFVV